MNLEKRLNDAGRTLVEVETLLQANPGAVTQALEDGLLEVAAAHRDIPAWKRALGARDAARAYLNELLNDPSSEDVDLGRQKVSFSQGRLIGVDAYLASMWAVADRIAALVGRVVCVNKLGGFAAQSKNAGLVQHFVQTEKGNAAGPSLLWNVVKLEYGWPIGIAYALRNHFVHDAAQLDGAAFFKGEVKASGFSISQVGVDHLVDKTKEYNVSSKMCSKSCSLSVNENDDLRDILDQCETEVEGALGFLLASATSTLKHTTGVMLGAA